MTSDAVTAAAAGTWKLGDLTVNRMGFGAMRLPQAGRALAAGALRLSGEELALLQSVAIPA